MLKVSHLSHCNMLISDLIISHFRGSLELGLCLTHAVCRHNGAYATTLQAVYVTYFTSFSITMPVQYKLMSVVSLTRVTL